MLSIERKRNIGLAAILGGTLLFAACAESSASSVNPTPTMENGNTPIKFDDDLELFLKNKPDYRKIYESARQKNLGLVLFTINEATWEIKIRFSRVNVPFSEKNEYDKEEIIASPSFSPNGQPNPSDNLFLARACSGEYRLDVSTDDGKSFQNVPVSDLTTGVPNETFKLRPSCVRPVYLTFPKLN